MPSIVWLNGSIPPRFVVKFTDVPSGAGVPAVVVTYAVTVEISPESIVKGFAKTSTFCMDTGFKVSETILKAPLSANAVILITVGRSLSVDGITLTSIDACPFVSVVAMLPRGNVASSLSDPNRISVPTTRRPNPSKTVAVIVTSLSLAVSKSS